MDVENAVGCSCSAEANQTCSCDEEWVTGRLSTPAGEVKRVSTRLSFKDTLGSWKARWGIKRMNFKVSPGLYCVGTPDGESPVLVTANYKMSFDRLRRELEGLNAWILVLDTKGINVWCAAGKGTFGTGELVLRINKTGLSGIVTRKAVILPQLGAPGVAAHEVRRLTGFKVIYGPVRAQDIRKFIDSGMEATREMRAVRFNFIDRLVLTPLEFVHSVKPALIVFGILFILNSLGFGSYGFFDICAYLGAVVAGCILTPALLPWIPGRAFALKGALLGVVWAVIAVLINGWAGLSVFEGFKTAAYIMILPAVSSYGAMNFTGCSTYTSLSGVKKEMKIAVPVMAVSAGLGIALLITGSIVKILI